jgi:hypothetical protein
MEAGKRCNQRVAAIEQAKKAPRAWMERQSNGLATRPAAMKGSRAGCWSLFLVILPVVLLILLTLSATPALAVPEWQLEVSHHNAYGLQAGECPGGHESLSGEPFCGVDPFTGSGTSFSRESGFNTYMITVKNVGDEPAGLASVGQTVTCSQGVWSHSPTGFSYQWLSGGEPLEGATSSSYTIQAANAGKAVQCQVTATNPGGSIAAASSGEEPIIVAPSPAGALPHPPRPLGLPEGLANEAGSVLTCHSGTWENSPTTYTYLLLRNGVNVAEIPTSAETEAKFTLTAENVATAAAFQCEVIGHNAAGSVATFSLSNRRTSAPAPVPSTLPPRLENEQTPVTGPLLSVSDKLPSGILVSAENINNRVDGVGWNCVVQNGASAVTCTRQAASQELAPGASYPPIAIHTLVNGSAVSAVNLVSISGGGAATVSTSDPTTVTEAVPFGIDSFTTSVVESLASPFTAAAGHPFAASAELVFNYTPMDAGFLTTAGGGPKSLTVGLPPGFVGNPQTTAQCPLSTLQRGFYYRCPKSSAVGYVELVTAGGPGPITGGKAKLLLAPGDLEKTNSSLVYNIQSPPGHPAEFGFLYSGTGVVLTGKVRSDGDYGVTLDAGGIPDSLKLFSSRLTFCENGATEIDTGGFGREYHCNPAGPGSQAFMTLPARCGSIAPTTTAASTPWDDPADEVSKTVFTGTSLVEERASEVESFVTGCGNAELGSRWNASSIALAPETTRADSPTGMRFDLTTPQNDEARKLATPELRNTTVVLPQGMTVSPSAVEGLEGCSDAQIAVHSTAPGGCPVGSQVATAEVFTPLLSASPVAEGVPRVGESITCKEGTWNGAASFAYQWLRNGVALVGATGREYGPIAADENQVLQCQVTASNGAGSSVAVSRGVVVAEAFYNQELETTEYREPAIAPPLLQTALAAPAGTVSADHMLVCRNAVWEGEPTFTYRWLRDGAPIAGAETTEYTLTSEDAGKAIQCQVTARNAGGPVLADSEAIVGAPQPSTLPPLLGAPVQGKVFIGRPLCSPCSSQDAQEGHIFRLFIEVADPERGVIVKFSGTVSANPSTGQLTATFRENPQLPFEDIKLLFKNGPQAPLATPQACGQATTTSDLTPWSSEPGIKETEGTPDAFPSSSFNVDWDGHGGACPSSVPFAPGFQAQSMNTIAGAFTPFTVRFTREDREQDLSGVSVQTPLGLLGKIAGIPQCPEAQANTGSCSAESRIGTTTVGAGPGSHPFFLSGPAYLTGPYKGAPFGLSIAVPAVAGPFNLGTVVVRAAINVNPATAAITVTSDPLPQIVDGVPIRLRDVRVMIDRAGFIFNPTNCSTESVGAILTGEHVNSGEQNETSTLSAVFAVGGCASLPFAPSFSASTQARTSKANGASLDVKVAQNPGEANILKLDAQVPKLLPTRLTTLQKACTEAQFAANPAACPGASDVGVATAHTPILNGPLVGPAYLVSHGGAAFPDLEIILQGEGVKIVLDGNTDIKNGVTFSRFEAVPDAPINSFELSLPEGPHSILAAPSGVCGQNLVMPTTITAQNGKQIVQNTKIGVAGCVAVKAKSLTRAQKLAKALRACRKKKNKRKRKACERQARRRYGAKAASRNAIRTSRGSHR